jgi:hypothetical protein
MPRPGSKVTVSRPMLAGLTSLTSPVQPVALIDKGFSELGVQRVVASTIVVNVASRRVMEKAGLRFVRTFHQPWPDYIDGEEEGDVEYALRRSEWEQITAVETAT